MVCRGICLQYHWARKMHQNTYLEGAKRCMNDCAGNEKIGMTIKYDGVWCPCCHKRLRTRPRNSEYKRHYLKERHKVGL